MSGIGLGGPDGVDDVDGVDGVDGVARGVRLWLDDVRPAPDGWVHAFTAAEAIAHLGAGVVVEVSLDHDLGPVEAGTGYVVACWIEEAAAYGRIPPLRWAVHSANPVGRARMEAALAAAERWWRGRG